MKYVYILSDSVGETAERFTRAVTGQFTNTEFIFKKHAYLSDPVNILDIIKNAKIDGAIVVFTTVMKDIRRVIVQNCIDREVPYIDIMGSAIDEFQKFLNEDPVRSPGIIRKLDESYFERIKAVEFAVKYDDGKDPRGIRLADIVLLGISRTSKTPLSMYLAHRGMKVANVPLVPEMNIPRDVYNVDPSKIFGLVISPRVLLRIREQRAARMGLNMDSTYASMDRIKKELEFGENIMKEVGCHIIDVSNKATEETAYIILNKIKK